MALFSKTPGGRLKKDGPDSGEQFREEILEPAFKASDEIINVFLDGVQYGYATSFLDESFGGLARIYGSEKVQKKIHLISNDEVKISEIKSYIKGTNSK